MQETGNNGRKSFQNAFFLIVALLMNTEFSSHSLFLTFFLLTGLDYEPILAGMIIASYFISWLLFASYAGSLSDKYGWKKFLILGSILSGSCFLLQPLWNNYIFLLVLNIFNGLGYGLLLGPVLALIAQFTPRENYSVIMGIFYTAQGIGGILGLILGSLAWDFLGIFGSPVFAGIALIIVIVVLLSGSSEGRDIQKIELVSISEIAEFKNILNPFSAIIDGWKLEIFRKYAIAWLAFSTLVAGGGQYLPVIIVELTNEAITATGVLLLLVPPIVLIALSQPVIGYLADKFGRVLFQYLGIIGAMSLISLFGALVFQDILAVPGSSSQILAFISEPLAFSPLVFLNVVPVPKIFFTVALVVTAVLATCFIPSSMGILLAGIGEEEKAKSLGLFNALVGTGTTTGVLLGALFLSLFGYAGVILMCFLLTCLLWAVKFA
ncbi:MAG: MFS transporter [Candidatus Hodarchaeales archaeon]|jgi:MFS family permease